MFGEKVADTESTVIYMCERGISFQCRKERNSNLFHLFFSGRKIPLFPNGRKALGRIESRNKGPQRLK